MTKPIIIAALLSGASVSPALAQDLSERLETYICTLSNSEGESGVTTVTLIPDETGTLSVLNPWADAEIAHDGDRVVLTEGTNFMQIDADNSIMIDGGVVFDGHCEDVSYAVRLMVEQSFEAATAANPDAMTARAQREVDQVQTEAQAAIQRAQSDAQEAVQAALRRAQAMGELRSRNAALSAQIAAMPAYEQNCREALDRLVDHMLMLSRTDPQRRAVELAEARQIAKDGCNL